MIFLIGELYVIITIYGQNQMTMGSYAIGVSRPTSIRIEDFGTAHINDVGALKDHIMETVDLRPMAIINRFGLRRPIYAKLAAYGHFGENAKDMPWERLDLAL